MQSFCYILTDCVGVTAGPLGMEDETISPSKITASSFEQHDDNRHATWQARLRNDNYWRPDSDSECWIQITFTTATIIAGIRTQGAGSTNRYVIKLKIRYGEDSSEIITDQEGIEMVRNVHKIHVRHSINDFLWSRLPS